MRIVSLTPGATEILCALGLAESLVGISHACDYPPQVYDRPRVTGSLVPPDLPSEEIHRLVHESTASGKQLYSIDAERLAALVPDLVVTQDQCSVCAISKRDVTRALAQAGCRARAVSLSARHLSGIFEDIRRLGDATGHAERATDLVKELRSRLQAVRAKTAHEPRPRVFCVSWFSPLMAASHWVTDMVKLAGGRDSLGQEGSTPVRPERLRQYSPEVIFLMPCGFPLTRIIAEWGSPPVQAVCARLPAVRDGRVFAMEGSLFHRPGPRVVDGIELLTRLLHPDRFCERVRLDLVREVA